MMKRILSAALVILLLFSLTACQGNSNADLEAMKLQMQLMQKQLDEAKEAGYEPSEPAEPVQAQTPAPEAPAEAESGYRIVALHSTVDGETSLIADGTYELVAEADIPERMAVDYWEVNGIPYYEDMTEAYLFVPQEDTVVDARLRPEHKVTTINAEMQFLDKKGKPKGEEFTEFVFEEDYENPVTHETCLGDWITVNVKAVVPKGYAVDYWLINDIPYYYNRTVTNFTVHDLNETTVYEVVLKKENAPSSTPKPTVKPTVKPTQQPVQTPYVPVQTPYVPEPTEAPVVMYSVSCTYCTFSGGGYSGATSGTVPAGTRITVTEARPGSEVFWPSGSYINGENSDPGPSSFSYTVNSDCSFYCESVVN